MKVLITGANGFLGENLLQRLLKDDVEIVALVRDKSTLKKYDNKIIIKECQMSDYADLDESDEAFCGIDIIYHFAWAATSGDGRADVKLQLQNVESTCELVKFAGKIGCKRFINAASIMEYEAMSYLPQEKCNPGMGYIYSTAKLSADFMAKVLSANRGVSYSGVIISNIYGEGERSKRFIYTILNKMMENAEIALTHGEQLYDFIYISDAIEAIKLVAERGCTGSDYYIGNSVQRKLKEYVLEMKEIAGSTSELKFGSIAFNGSMNVYGAIDTEKMERELGFTAQISFKKGIELLISDIKGGSCINE